jgi:hypothetical protein
MVLNSLSVDRSQSPNLYLSIRFIEWFHLSNYLYTSVGYREIMPNKLDPTTRLLTIIVFGRCQDRLSVLTRTTVTHFSRFSGFLLLNAAILPQIRPWPLSSTFLFNLLFIIKSQYCAVSIVTRSWAGRSGVQTLAGDKKCISPPDIQTGSGALPASCAMGNGVLSRGKVAAAICWPLSSI